MSKLLKLREWSSVGDAAKRLSDKWSERVSESDVLRLALDGHLTLSVNFVIPAWGRCGERVRRDQTRKTPDSSRGLPITDEFELVKWQAGDVRGVWDLPMAGAERLEVERRYYRLTDGPDLEVAASDSGRPGLIYAFDPNKPGFLGSCPTYGYGLFVTKEDDIWCRLDRWGTRPGDVASITEPALEFPDGADLVVRTAVLEELEELARQLPSLWNSKPQSPPVTEPQRGYLTAPAPDAQTVGGPRMARWLAAEMERRDHMSPNRLHELSGLDRKTIKKMLNGKTVREVSRRKLADGLSEDGPLVQVSDVPTD